MTATIEEIRELIKDAETMTDIDTLVNDVPLSEQGVDSLDMANILLLMEEKYDIKIPDKDISQIQSVDAIVDYLNNK